MAVDTNIPLGKPGVAEFKSESFGGPADIRYGEGALTTTEITITAPGGGLDLPLGAVIAANGTLANQAGATAPDRANYILAEPIVMAAAEVMTVAVYREGHFNMDALTWDASYTTDAQKAAAFEGSVSPTIFVSKPKHNADAIY